MYLVARVASFDFDARDAFVSGGPLGAAAEILRSCFGWKGSEVSSAESLLAELQRPETQSLVEWRQDVLLSPSQPLAEGVRMIATENQSVWQAAQRPDGSVELGVTHSGGWTAWVGIDLAELLCRMLAMEAVVGHGPCMAGSELPEDNVRPFEMLQPLELSKGQAQLPGVVATDTWFGVTLGTGSARWIYASPVDRVRQHLLPIAPSADWQQVP